jgi:hypothetical protein
MALIPQCFRYEKQQRGRLREHFQFNADIIGEASLDRMWKQRTLRRSPARVGFSASDASCA